MIGAELVGVDELRRMLGSQLVEQAMTSTLNKLASKASTAASRQIRDKYAIKAKDLRKRGRHNRRGLSVIKARRGRAMAVILSTGKKLPLINFSVSPKTPEKDLERKRRRGVRYTVVRGRRVHARRAFVARMRSGHEGVFLRKTDQRLPIRELFGPSIPDMFRERSTIDALAQVINTDASRIFEHELRFRIDRARRRSGGA